MSFHDFAPEVLTMIAVRRRVRWMFAFAGALSLVLAGLVLAAPRTAPEGLFKTLDDAVVGDAVLINGKQLFIDDYLIESLNGVEKVLNQPLKHPENPLLVRDKPWEESGPGYSTMLYDQEEGLFKLWYQIWRKTEGTSTGLLCYATSVDGIHWNKPVLDQQTGSNLVSHPPVVGFQCPGIFKDLAEPDPQKRYKMLFSANPDGTAKTWSTGAAYSPDGIDWTPEPQYPLIPFSDTQICPFRDPLRGRFVAFLRFGPPNTRLISRIESDDFVSWSPKVTLFERSKLDEPFGTNHYTMQVTPYEGIYIGFLDTYHGETIQPIPDDKLWMDKANVQLAFSRNGVTWLRVGAHGAFQPEELQGERDWKAEAEQATFLPYGEHKKAWDWGSVYACYQPTIVVDDEIRIYYFGYSGRHWATYHGDTQESAFGLATLRLDGFVSVETAGEGTLTTRPFVFLGDTLEVNADAADGSIQVEALDAEGNVLEGFSKSDCTPISTDGLRHQLAWNGTTNCQLLQARPIKLRFYLKGAKLYSFTPRARHTHYVQSYD